MKKFEFVVAAFLAVIAVPIVLWSYNNWQRATGQGTYSSTTSITGSPSVSADKVNAILCNAKSPACGTGYALYSYGIQYNVDPAFALAVFKHESSLGKADIATQTLSLGNIRCTDGYACVNGYRAYPSWQASYSDFYKLISGPLYVGSGLTTPEQIMSKYAPVADGNDPVAYAADVEAAMTAWRAS